MNTNTSDETTRKNKAACTPYRQLTDATNSIDKATCDYRGLAP
jgi:hypothetical protein